MSEVEEDHSGETQSPREAVVAELNGRLAPEDQAGVERSEGRFERAVKAASELIAKDTLGRDVKASLLPNWIDDGKGNGGINADYEAAAPLIEKALGAQADHMTHVTDYEESPFKWNTYGPEALRVIPTAYPNVVLVQHVFLDKDQSNAGRTRMSALELVKQAEQPDQQAA